MGVLYVRMQLNTAWPVVGDAYIVNTTQNEQGRINKCGGPVRKNVWGPPPPYAVESRIESKMAHPFNVDKRPTTVFGGSMYSIS